MLSRVYLQEWALRARRDGILECLEIVQRILPAHDDLSCCFGLRQNILCAIEDRLSHPDGCDVERGEGVQVVAAS